MATMAPTEHRADPWLVDLYRSHYRDLVRLAALLVDDRGLAEEVVQDAFVSVARRRGRTPLDDAGSAPAYLRSAVLNGARSELRRRAVRRRHLRSVTPPASAPGADQQALADAETRRVLVALRQLATRQREVLVLRYYAELSEAEIADALGVSAGSVKTHAHRGLSSLSRLLEAE